MLRLQVCRRSRLYLLLLLRLLRPLGLRLLQPLLRLLIHRGRSHLRLLRLLLLLPGGTNEV